MDPKHLFLSNFHLNSDFEPPEGLSGKVAQQPFFDRYQARNGTARLQSGQSSQVSAVP
jgi:hypothetical protein